MRFFVKFIFDRFFSLLAILFFSPLFILVSLIILSEKPGGSVFFRQKRVGKDGKLFTLLKFRTMIPNADPNTITAGNDKRITAAGAFLRKWKIDELPELFNILNGDMSFVGPRPDVPGYADTLQGEDRRILILRPGITGPATLKYLDEEKLLASVSNPKDYNDTIIFPDKVRINLKYLEKFSLAEDLKMIFFTIFRKKINAY